MKICFFGTYFANYARNTSIREGLKRCGIEVAEVHAEIANIPMDQSNDVTLFKVFYRFARKIKVYIRLLSRYREVLSADYIFVLHPGHFDLPFAWILSKLGGKKLFFDSSISHYDTMFVGETIGNRRTLKAKIIKLAEKFCLLFPDRIFVDTEAMKDFMVSEFKISEEKIFVVPLGANDTLYKPNGKVKHNGTTDVFFFGLYNRMQGADIIMKAINLLKEDSDIAFTMLGDGSLKTEFVEFARNHNLTNVHFVGFVPEKELVSHLQQADIALGVFSNSPVFQRVIPNKVFAALACAKPLITARYQVLEEVLHHEYNVFFCKPENPEDLAKAIRSVSRNRRLQETLSQNGYVLYKRNFTPDKIGKTLADHLHN